MALESNAGVHSREKKQYSGTLKTTAQKLSEFAKLDNNRAVASESVEEIDNYKMKVLPDLDEEDILK
jgi:hypothetical protein